MSLLNRRPSKLAARYGQSRRRRGGHMSSSTRMALGMGLAGAMVPLSYALIAYSAAIPALAVAAGVGQDEDNEEDEG